MITADEIEKEVYFKYGREVAEFIYPMLLELEDDSEERGYGKGYWMASIGDSLCEEEECN